MKSILWLYVLAICLSIIWTNCSSTSENHLRSISKIQTSDLVGTWRNLSMTIIYQDMDSVYEVPEGKWEEILGIQPIKTTYRSDSTFQSEYFNLDGSLLFTTSGKWYLRGDSLYLEAQGVITAYKCTMENQVGRFTGILDWNEDGKRNELYDGRQQKL